MNSPRVLASMSHGRLRQPLVRRAELPRCPEIKGPGRARLPAYRRRAGRRRALTSSAPGRSERRVALGLARSIFPGNLVSPKPTWRSALHYFGRARLRRALTSSAPGRSERRVALGLARSFFPGNPVSPKPTWRSALHYFGRARLRRALEFSGFAATSLLRHQTAECCGSTESRPTGKQKSSRKCTVL